MQRTCLWALLTLLLLPSTSRGEDAPRRDPTRDQAVYQPKYKDPVLTTIEEKGKAEEQKSAEETHRIHERQAQENAAAEKALTTLRFDLSQVRRPAGPEVFKAPFHFPPVPQFLTNTCWSFSATSFFEAEAFRISGKKVKLSEMYTVYFEYLEKVRRFVRERGASYIAEGSESGAPPRIWKQYGIVPAETYKGFVSDDPRYDHSHLIQEIEALTQWVKEQNLWNEDTVIAMTRALLDRRMGPPPTSFTWQGREYTPQQFLATELKLNLDDYVELMSTLSAPFYRFAEYRFPDNWWHDDRYLNVPLDEWYAALRKAAANGYTAVIGGDVSEPGYNGFENIAVVPTFDIPADWIDQSSRELRIANRSTDDDHGLHLIGLTVIDGKDWFLIKDSGRSSRWGKHQGYYFFRADYVRLKMLTFLVHKDAVKDLLAKAEKAAGQP